MDNMIVNARRLKMKFHFLGTSYGAPTAERHCQSILIETTDDSAYLVDAGAPVIDILVRQGYDLSKIKGIFITHRHGDHMNGLFDIQYLAGVYGMRCKVYVPEQRIIDFMQEYFTMQFGDMKNELITYEVIKEGLCCIDGGLKVMAFRTAHLEASYGFIIEQEGIKVCITGDLSASLEDFPQDLRNENISLLVTECAHFDVDIIMEKIKESNIRKVAFLHVFPTIKYEYIKKQATDSTIEILLPKDGDFYEL